MYENAATATSGNPKLRTMTHDLSDSRPLWAA
jgi:hypothetical protein